MKVSGPGFWGPRVSLCEPHMALLCCGLCVIMCEVSHRLMYIFRSKVGFVIKIQVYSAVIIISAINLMARVSSTQHSLRTCIKKSASGMDQSQVQVSDT